MENPYAPGAMPAYLAGRGTELDRIRGRAARMRTLRRSGGPLLAFHAPRGVGKTSLLREAQREAIDAGYLTVWVTGREDEAMLPSLAREVGREIKRTAAAGPAQGILHRLDQVQVQFGVPGISVGAQVDVSQQRATQVVEEVLEDAARFAQNHEMHGLVLFVDEFQDAQLADRKSVLIALQHFDGDPRGCPVTAIAAGLPSLPRAVTEAATFGERSQFEEVGLLADVAVAEALTQPAERLGVTWSTEALETAIEAAKGYGHTVQLVGHETWTYARPEPGSTLTDGHVRGGQEEVARRMQSLMETRLAKATPEQKRFLAAMAEEGGDTTRAAVADRLGTDSRALSRPRQELIDRGLVESAGHGRIRFTIPGFTEFIRERNEPSTPAAGSFPVPPTPRPPGQTPTTQPPRLDDSGPGPGLGR